MSNNNNQNTNKMKNAVILVNGHQYGGAVFATYGDAKRFRDSRFQSFMSSDKFVSKRSHGAHGIGITMKDDHGNHIHETWKIVKI